MRTSGNQSNSSAEAHIHHHRLAQRWLASQARSASFGAAGAITALGPVPRRHLRPLKSSRVAGTQIAARAMRMRGGGAIHRLHVDEKSSGWPRPPRGRALKAFSLSPTE